MALPPGSLVFRGGVEAFNAPTSAPWHRSCDGGEFSETSYAFARDDRFFTQSMADVGMADALNRVVMSLLKPENRALRALLWLVIVLLPGGLFLLALLAADHAARRYRLAPPAPDGDLSESLPGLGPSRG